MPLSALMLILGVVAAVFAIAMSTPVNAAAVAAGLACFCGILARLFQADAHHRAITTKPKPPAAGTRI